MEEILNKFLSNDVNVLMEGTEKLKEAFKRPEAIPVLCEVLVTSSNYSIRQMAALILRRRLGKRNQWNKLSEETRTRIKQGILQALVNEQEKLVKNAIAAFIGLIAKHEFPNNKWPEILQFINHLSASDNIVDKEMAMYTLSIMTEISKNSYLPHVKALGLLFTNMLTSLPQLDSNLAYYTVCTMNQMVPVITDQQELMNVYHTLLPKILEIINAFSSSDARKTCDLLEIIENLIEFSVTVIMSHIRPIVMLCLKFATDTAIDNSIQIKAVSVIGWIIRVKSKVIQKNRLIEPVINVLMTLMAQQPEDDVNEEYFLGDPDQFTSTTVATQTLDLIALNVPPENVVPYILTRIEPALQGEDVYAQKASYLALAVLAEGCADHIRTKYLESFLKCICNGIRNPNVVVRNAAFFALGQFSEHLQPEISQYASELLPVFFENLSHLLVQTQASKVEPSGLDRMFYALQSFCMNLEDGLIPYLPVLMERLLIALKPDGWSFNLKRVALNTLDAVATAVKGNISPYFNAVLKMLNVYIGADPDSPMFQLQSYALDCLATIIEEIDIDKFKPLAPQTLKMAMEILNESTDPDVRKSVYSLLSSLARILQDDLAPVLPKIVEEMLSSLQNSDGISQRFEDEDVSKHDIYGISDSDEEEQDIEVESSSSDSTECRYSVENSYQDEKEQAALCLTDIAKKIPLQFLPFLEKCFEEMFKLLAYPQEDIRSAALAGLEEFCIILSQTQNKLSLHNALKMFVPKCAEVVKYDEETTMVIQAVNAFGNLLDKIQSDVLVGDGHREAIVNSLIDLLAEKTSCQDTDIGGTGVESSEDVQESEQSELLLECAGEVIPKFGNALTPNDFVLYFPNILELLTIRTKKKNSISQRSFAYGALAECMRPLGHHIMKFIPQLLQLWVTGAKDPCDEVRNNAVYGIGEMILHGGECMFAHYNNILQGLSTILRKESHAGTIDNICGAIAKMIMSNPNGTPLDQLLQILMQHLPLKVDFQENEAIVKCFYGLYRLRHEKLIMILPNVIKIVIHIYHNKQTSNESTTNIVVEFLKTVNSDFSQEFANIVSSCGPDVTESIRQLFT